MNRFACGSCGTELFVERRGGTAALKHIRDATTPQEILVNSELDNSEAAGSNAAGLNAARPKTPTTDAENRYKNLLSYFKNLVWITLIVLGIIVGIGLSFFHRDMAEVKSDAKAAIDNTRNLASLQISQIREQAATIALSEAQKKVDYAFGTTNVVTMVESAAKRQVGQVIERQVQEEVDHVMSAIQQDITSLGQIADAAMKMRIGIRAGLEELSTIQKTASSENVRKMAKVLLESITDDYESISKDVIRREEFPNAIEALKVYRTNEAIDEFKDEANVVSDLIKVIRTKTDLNLLAVAFLGLREKTGFPFRMFDVEAVERWCAEHEANCK